MLSSPAYWPQKILMEKDPAIYVIDEDGCLRCTDSTHKSDPFWCSHIEGVILSALDKDWCFSSDIISVPIFPTLGAWAEPRIDAEISNGSRKIFMPVLSGGNYDSNLDFVGFLSPGEGRGVIRNMLIEWALPKVHSESNPHGLSCRSRNHGPKAQITLEKNTSLKYQKANAWFIATEEQCLVCAQSAKVDATFDMEI